MNKFIAIEGIEGCGKSTLIKALVEHMQSKGIAYEVTREPGGTEISERIRELLLTDKGAGLNSISELLLLNASRAQLIQEKIAPWLKEGKVVITDRFHLSTIAYQGGGRGISMELIQRANDIAIGQYKPAITLLLDIDVKTSKERVLGRGVIDRIESENDIFYTKVRNAYLRYAKEHSNEVVIIDARKDIELVTKEALELLSFYCNI